MKQQQFLIPKSSRRLSTGSSSQTPRNVPHNDAAVLLWGNLRPRPPFWSRWFIYMLKEEWLLFFFYLPPSLPQSVGAADRRVQARSLVVMNDYRLISPLKSETIWCLCARLCVRVFPLNLFYFPQPLPTF